MEIEKFLELTQELEKRRRRRRKLERFKKFFERFQNLNRAYLDKETLKSRGVHLIHVRGDCEHLQYWMRRLPD